MTAHFSTQPEWTGVDVSKNHLDVFSPSLGAFRVANTAQGFTALADKIAHRPAHLIMEATGGYETALLKAMTERAIKASIVNPARVRDFAKGSGQLAKTDKIDAKIIAEYGAYKKPPATPLPSLERAQLKELLAYRAQIVAEIVARTAQLRHIISAQLKARAEQALGSLKAERKSLDGGIEALIKGHQSLRQTFEILTSTPCVGLIVGATLIADLPELGMLSRRQIAALAGLAPFPRESGQRKGYRKTDGGRAEVRHALFNAARVGARFNPKLKAFCERLAQKSKPGKVVLVAAMRKLLTILNAMLKSQKNWMQA